jgi:hypothetical protein
VERGQQVVRTDSRRSVGPYQALPLIGGHHDWAFILGRLGALDASGAIAAWVKGTGAVLVLTGVGACLAGGLVPPPRDDTVPVIP